jgi:ABC-2 type transport system permease protein
MKNIQDMLWVEWRKAVSSKIPLWTAICSIFMPLAIAFLIFAARNPEISQKLGLISVKANLVAYSSTNWSSYLGLTGMIIAAGGFFLFVLAVSWIFGREFADGTVKDMLAVPVQRSSILLAKLIVAAIWFILLTIVILIVSLIMGAVINLPGGSFDTILQSIFLVLITDCLVIAVSLPFALVASAGRGYILPLGLAVLTLILTNVVAIAGWGDYFPWAIPGIFAQGKNTLTPVSYLIAVLTGLAGMAGTYFWWKYADQNR